MENTNNQPNQRRLQLPKSKPATGESRPPLSQPQMTRAELLRANEALLARRKREGVGERPAILTLSPDAITWEEYFTLKAKTGEAEAITGKDDKWRAFDSDRNPILKRAVKIIKCWYDGRLDSGGALILAGNCGCGKTHLAQAIYDLFGFGATYLNEVELVERLQAGYGKTGGGQSLESMAGYVRRSRLLIFDDLGAYETDNDKWMQNIYMTLLNGRKEEGKATLITTNLKLLATEGNDTWSPLEARLGKRVYSRLMGQVEEVKFYVDLFGVPDYRLRNF